MYQGNHGRRNVISNIRYSDAPMPSNPLAIPRNQGIASIPRGPTSSTNYQFNLLGQSPQHGPYASPSVYPSGTPSDANTSHNQPVPASPTLKSHANGQSYYYQQRMQIPSQPQGQHQNVYNSGSVGPKYSQQTMQNSQFSFPQNPSMPAGNPPYAVAVRARFSNAPVVSSGPQMPSGVSFYPANHYYSNQPVPYATPYDFSMTYSPNNQQSVHATVMPPQPTSQATPAPKKAIKIIDPSTMEEVDVKTEKAAEADPTPQPKAAAVTEPEQDQIAARFAAQVAAAATSNAQDKSTQPVVVSAETSAMPSGIDASVPPPSVQNISHTMPATPASESSTENAVPPPPVQENGVVAAPESKNDAPAPARPVVNNNARSSAPVAVVLPVVKDEAPPRKIEKILSRGEALPEMKDSKTAEKDEKTVEPVAEVTKTISFEGDTHDASVKKLTGAKPISTSPEQSEERTVTSSIDAKEPQPRTASDNAESVDVAPAVSDGALTDNEATEEKTIVAKSDSSPALQAKNTEGPATSNAEPVTEVVKQSAKSLSGGDTTIKERPEKTKATEVQAKSEEPLVVQTAPAPVKSQVSRSGSKEKKAGKSESSGKDSSQDGQSKKVQYERDFLMQCRDHKSTREKPIGLPNIADIVMDQCLAHVPTGLPTIASYGGGSDFSPSWMRNPRMERQTSRGSQGGQQRQGYYPQQPQKVIKKVSIQRDPEPELNKAENAWKPSKLEPKAPGAATSEEEQSEMILKTARSILNKLTPQKFTQLMQKFTVLPINSENRLRDVIDLIFEKAIDEPNFCEAYANMCRVMSQFRVTATGSSEGGNQQQAVVFRKVLLTRCQKEFEKDRSSENKLLELRKKVEEAKTADEKKQLKEELEYAEMTERRRIMGNIRFIGELFKLKMLTEAIMHNCIMSLFRSRDEESFESLCKLLTTIGKDLDHVKGKPLIDQYFSQIDKIISERKTSSRVRFMLQDVVDLRKNNWVQRAVKSQGPKTIDQIHQDAKEEKALKAAAAAATTTGPPVKSQSRGNRMVSRGSSHNLADDGWTNVSQKPMRIDPQKMKFSKSQIDESNVTLGPNRGKQAWKSGSGSGATKTGSGGFSYREHSDGMGPRSNTPTTMNRFSALSGGSDALHNRGAGRISSQERPKTGSRGSNVSGEPRSGARNERQSALDTARRLTSAERRPPPGPSPAAKPAPPVTEPKVDMAKITKKIDSTIAEYLQIYDVKEATECFDELNMSPLSKHVIVKECLEMTLEKSPSDRAHISKLLSTLVRNEKIPANQYLKGVVDNMELAVNLELDLPKVWTCLAEQIADIFLSSGGKINLDHLRTMAAPLLEVDRAAAFFAEVFKKLVTLSNLEKILQEWKKSNLDLEYFLRTTDPTRIKEFLARHNLLPMYDADAKVVATGIGAVARRLDFDEMVSAITKQLDKHSKADDIFDWVEATTTPEERAQPLFVRALITAVCNKAILQGDGCLEVNKDLVTSRSILLRKFIDHETKELQALFALQKLFVVLEQPPNVLKLLFDFLYDEEVISEQTFFDWEKSQDPNECEGKGVAISSVNPFLTWLRQADVESDE